MHPLPPPSWLGREHPAVEKRRRARRMTNLVLGMIAFSMLAFVVTRLITGADQEWPILTSEQLQARPDQPY